MEWMETRKGSPPHAGRRHSSQCFWDDKMHRSQGLASPSRNLSLLQVPGGCKVLSPQVSEIQLVSISKCKICKAWLLVEKTGTVCFHFLGDGDPWIWRWWALLTAWNGSSSLTLRSQLKRKQLAWLVLLKSCGLQPLELGLFIHLNWILAFTCVCSLHKDLFIWVPESCLLLSTCGRKKWLDWRC